MFVSKLDTSLIPVKRARFSFPSRCVCRHYAVSHLQQCLREVRSNDADAAPLCSSGRLDCVFHGELGGISFIILLFFVSTFCVLSRVSFLVFLTCVTDIRSTTTVKLPGLNVLRWAFGYCLHERQKRYKSVTKALQNPGVWWTGYILLEFSLAVRCLISYARG